MHDSMAVLAACVLVMGIYPAPFMEVLHMSVNEVLELARETKLP